MAKTYTKMMIDVTENINSIATAVQMDTQSRYLDVYLYNNGLPIDLTNEVVRINIRKPDGTTLFNQGEVTDATEGRCQFELTNDILAEAKPVDAQISIWSSESQILSTKVFKIYVSESLRNDEEVEASNEFGVMVVLFTEIQNALDLMNSMVEAFGEPSEIAEQYNATSFWQMLEALVQNADVKALLKAYVNSTIDTGYFVSIDKLISSDAGTANMMPINEMLKVTQGGSQTFTEDGTFIVPEGVNRLRITAAGGGGGGGGGATTTNKSGAGGGGGAECICEYFAVTPGQEISVTIGKGGEPGVVGSQAGSTNTLGTDGSAGGVTIIGDLVTVAGGYGGKGTSTSAGAGGNAGGEGGGVGGKGSTSTSDGPYDGEDGMFGPGGTGVLNGGGGGGGSYGAGGNGGTNQSSTETATEGQFGGGGGGAAYRSNSSSAGKKGGDGIVIIEWGIAAA